MGRVCGPRTQRMVVMGVDPGFASVGMVVLFRDCAGTRPYVVDLRVVTTAKVEKKERSGLRVTDDDKRRYAEICGALTDFVDPYDPHAAGVEAYVVNPKQPGSAKGAKAAIVYGGTIFWAVSRGMFVVPFLPSDLKRRFCGKKSASKSDVEEAVCGLVDGLDVALEKIPKTKREHVADAAGHAVLVLEEVDRARHMLGLA